MLKNYSVLSEIPSPSETAEAVRKRISGRAPGDGELSSLIWQLICCDPHFLGIRPAKYAEYARKVYCCLRCDLELLQDLADDPGVSEVMVNGPDKVFVERRGKIEKTDVRFDSAQQLATVIRRLAARVGREMNDLNPIVDARLPDGSRINAVNDNIAIGGPILTIRKFSSSGLAMDDLIRKGDISEEAAAFLENAVKACCNIFISGGTSSGKTTFLNILSDFIPESERLIVIEDSAELQIRNHENLVRMESKLPNSQGKGAVTIRDLIKTSLRMRPDRIVVGEVRSDEVIDMLAAMSTGHDGSLSTGHANSPKGMIGRLETMHISGSGFPLTAVRNQIADAIELIVQLKRFPGGQRRVTEITEVCGVEDGEIKLNTLFERRGDGPLVKREDPVRTEGKLKAIYGQDPES